MESHLQSSFQETVVTLKAQLPDPVYQAAWLEGQTMTVEAATDYVLALTPPSMVFSAQ
jgi:hypothetical protein